MKIEGKPKDRKLMAVNNAGVLSFRDGDRFGYTTRINIDGEGTMYGVATSLEDLAKRDGAVAYYEGDSLTITF